MLLIFIISTSSSMQLEHYSYTYELDLRYIERCSNTVQSEIFYSIFDNQD